MYKAGQALNQEPIFVNTFFKQSNIVIKRLDARGQRWDASDSIPASISYISQIKSRWIQ